MMYKQLQSKSAKQLVTFLYNKGWNKEKLIYKLIEHDDEIDPHYVWYEITFETLCESRHDLIVNIIWEEIYNAGLR